MGQTALVQTVKGVRAGRTSQLGFFIYLLHLRLKQSWTLSKPEVKKRGESRLSHIVLSRKVLAASKMEFLLSCDQLRISCQVEDQSNHRISAVITLSDKQGDRQELVCTTTTLPGSDRHTDGCDGCLSLYEQSCHVQYIDLNLLTSMTCKTVRLIDRQTEMDRYLGRQIQFSRLKYRPVTEIRRIFFQS